MPFQCFQVVKDNYLSRNIAIFYLNAVGNPTKEISDIHMQWIGEEIQVNEFLLVFHLGQLDTLESKDDVEQKQVSRHSQVVPSSGLLLRNALSIYLMPRI